MIIISVGMRADYPVRLAVFDYAVFTDDIVIADACPPLALMACIDLLSAAIGGGITGMVNDDLISFGSRA